jgi:hypothetical protein
VGIMVCLVEEAGFLENSRPKRKGGWVDVLDIDEEIMLVFLQGCLSVERCLNQNTHSPLFCCLWFIPRTLFSWYMS